MRSAKFSGRNGFLSLFPSLSLSDNFGIFISLKNTERAVAWCWTLKKVDGVKGSKYQD